MPEAAEAYRRALALVSNEAERRHLEKRLREIAPVAPDRAPLPGSRPKIPLDFPRRPACIVRSTIRVLSFGRSPKKESQHALR